MPKKPSYEGTTAHGGEYEGKLVEQEHQRIEILSEKFESQTLKVNQSIGFKEEKSWWKKILGI